MRRRGGRWKLAAAALLAVLLAAVLTAMAQLRPIMDSMATARVSNVIHKAVAEAVSETIATGRYDYTDLIRLEKDDGGKITALTSNMIQFNQLQIDVSENVMKKVGSVSSSELSIPVGSLTGSALLAGRGPRITVRMQAVGSSEANFRNAFTSAGINQTKHQIILTVDVSVSILLPGFRTATKVSNSFIVAETVIVGTVPDTYTYFSTDPDTYEEDLKDYILNNS